MTKSNTLEVLKQAFEKIIPSQDARTHIVTHIFLPFTACP